MLPWPDGVAIGAAEKGGGTGDGDARWEMRDSTCEIRHATCEMGNGRWEIGDGQGQGSEEAGWREGEGVKPSATTPSWSLDGIAAAN